MIGFVRFRFSFFSLFSVIRGNFRNPHKCVQNKNMLMCSVSTSLIEQTNWRTGCCSNFLLMPLLLLFLYSLHVLSLQATPRILGIKCKLVKNVINSIRAMTWILFSVVCVNVLFATAQTWRELTLLLVSQSIFFLWKGKNQLYYFWSESVMFQPKWIVSIEYIHINWVMNVWFLQNEHKKSVFELDR